MQIITAMNIKKYFGDRLILSFEELKIKRGDKIGIVGQNGAGKTTLLNLLSGELQPDEGTVKSFCKPAYIKQFSDEIQDVADTKTLSEFQTQSKIVSQNMSGGEKTRIKIAEAVSKDSILLLADEPTANLDFNGLKLLKERLKNTETLVLISHDKDLLDAICNRIIEVKDGKLNYYSGSFSFYSAAKEKEIQREWLEFEKYMDEKNHLVQAVEDRKLRAKAMKKTPKRMGNSEARLHKREAIQRQQKLNNAVNSMKTRLEKLEVKNKPKEVPVIKLDFSLTRPPENKVVISAESFSFNYEKKAIFKSVAFSIFNGKKQALIGENGAGKTTLLNEIYRCHNNSEYVKTIRLVPKAVIGYFYQGFENLQMNKTVLENVMADSIQNETTVRTVLGRLLLSGDDVYKKVDVLSGGEKIKVCFAKLFVSNANVLLLDEPTNYLDMASIEALQGILREYEGTVLFVSHDKAFVNAVADRLLIISNKRITEFEGTLSEYKKINATPPKIRNNETEKILLQMRIAEILSKLSGNVKDRDKLEEEYQQLLIQIKSL